MVAFKSTAQKPLFSNIKVNLIVIFVVIIILIILGVRSHIPNFFGLMPHPSLKSHLTLFTERPRLMVFGSSLASDSICPLSTSTQLSEPSFQITSSGQSSFLLKTH